MLCRMRKKQTIQISVTAHKWLLVIQRLLAPTPISDGPSLPTITESMIVVMAKEKGCDIESDPEEVLCKLENRSYVPTEPTRGRGRPKRRI